MRIAIGCDHAGFLIKNAVVEAIQESGHEIIDFGTNSGERVDYPDYAQKVGKAIQDGKAERGIAICGSGIGVCITANKMNGIYASVCHDTYTAHQGVEHDMMNVLCLGGRVIGPDLTKDIVKAFLSAQFDGKQSHLNRVEKFKAIEANRAYQE